MYIPTQFFGANNNCVSASSTANTQTNLYFSSSLYKVDIFSSTGSHSYNVHTGSTQYKVFVVGGGGSGGVTHSPISKTAGGGGAGQFIYLDGLVFSSGSYPITVGEGGVPFILSASGSNPTNGGVSTLQYTYTPSNPGTYPVTSATISANGGGGGATGNRNGVNTITIKGQNGASGGGGSIMTDGSANTYIVSSGSALYNPLKLIPNGFDGGMPPGPNGQGGGGGGASSVGAGVRDGGGGIDATSLGYPATFSQGGIGRTSNFGTPGLRPRTSGSGGSGVDKSDAAYSASVGNNGVVILMHKLCYGELSDCTTYEFDGGAVGGTLTYIECNTGLLVSQSIDFEQQGVICTLNETIGIGSDIKTYPSASGTLTLVATGSCNLNIDIPISPTCTIDETKTPLYIYNFETPSGCYPTPDNCQSQFGASAVIHYWGADGPVTYNFPGGFNNNSGTICAREYPAPTIQCGSVAFQTGTCAIVKSNLVCGYFCLSDSGSSYEIYLNTASSGSICNTSGIGDYYYLNTSQSLQTGSVLYNDYTLLSPVTASYFKEGSNIDSSSIQIYTTNDSGSITSITNCPVNCKNVTFNGGNSGGSLTFYNCAGVFQSTTMNRLNVFTTCVNLQLPITTTGTISYTTGSRCS